MKEGKAALHEHHPDVLLLDIDLPETSGIELAKEVRVFDVRLPVIFITAINDSDTAIEAMKMGAYDYLLKPLDVRQVEELVQRALETRRLMNHPVHLQPSETVADDGDLLVGRSPRMLDVYKQIGRIAAQDVTVLIRGESGTGKELIARAIYQHSHRVGECFMAVNCAALTESLLESELFGHEKGAFTGADRRRIGRFEQCNGGTIFLDEVGDMSPATQSKVLRLLQEQSFERVGGHETISVDVRLISATNRDLDQMIADNEFRLDLYHRLNGFEIYLPALRERAADLELLIDHFLKRFNVQLNKKITEISPPALELMKSYPWPGNIRELQTAIRRAMLMATGPTIVPELLPKEIVDNVPPGPGGGGSSQDEGGRGRSGPIHRPAQRRGVGESLSGNAANDGAISHHARAAREPRQSVEGGPPAGHHARKSAQQDARPGRADRANCRRRRVSVELRDIAQPPALAGRPRRPGARRAWLAG